MIKAGFEQDEEKCVVQSHRRVVAEKCVVMPRYRPVNLMVCPICSEQARRSNARFCVVCGHNLREDYAPLDSLKASYNLRKQALRQDVSPSKLNIASRLFVENGNGSAATALAFVTYSLVPYLGILFCPGAIVFGGIGLAVSFQNPQLGGRRSAAYSLLLGSLILAIQILLWRLLYLIPELNK